MTVGMLMRLVALVCLGVIAGIEWGWVAGVCSVLATWLVMPFVPERSA